MITAAFCGLQTRIFRDGRHTSVEGSAEADEAPSEKMRRQLQLVVLFLVSAVVGVGAYAFVYAKGYSYLLNDPTACANCHVMSAQYDAWIKSSHRSAATCNDCHTPHNLIGKYAVKASNGFFHSFYFTTGTYPDTIQITSFDRRVTEAACRHCHASIVEAIDVKGAHSSALGIQCTRCHSSVGHLEAAASADEALPVGRSR